LLSVRLLRPHEAVRLGHTNAGDSNREKEISKRRGRER
jgi:hypothetical protein